MKDTSFGIDNKRDFRSLHQTRKANKSEVNTIFRFCKGFESQFAAELNHLIEFKLEITERTTYFTDETDPTEYECNMLFVSTEDKAELLERLRKIVVELERLKTISVNVVWKCFSNLPLVSDEEAERMFPTGSDGKAVAICNRCTSMIDYEEVVGFCRQCEPPQIFCEKCTLLNRDHYEKFHNHYQRTQITDYRHCLQIVPSLAAFLN